MSSVAEVARHSSVGRSMSASGLPHGIAPQSHAPPTSSARDLAIFEERLRSNITYFRKRRRKYRAGQAALCFAMLVGFHGGFFSDTSTLAARWTYYLRLLFFVSLIALVVIQFRTDYQRTMDQAKMFAPRVNRVLHHFNLAFNRPGHPPELSFSKRIPIELVTQVDLARQEIQRRLQLVKQQQQQAGGGGSASPAAAKK
ncbi:hypothetical protein BCR44DRAFT_36193, partial [Catenaria anguillulae PL171]